METLLKIFLAALLAFSPAVAAADGGPPPVKAAFQMLAPYAFEENGVPVGVVPDTYRELERLSGLKFAFSFVPTKRMVHLLKNGDVDMAIYFAAPELAPHVVRLKKISEIVNIVVGLKGVDLASKEDLARVRVGVLRGGYFEQAFAQNPAWDYVPTVDYVQSVTLLQNGRVDALVGTAEGLLYSFQRAGIRADEVGAILHFSRSFSWAQMSKASDRINEADRIKAALAQMIDDCHGYRSRAQYLNAEMMALLNSLSGDSSAHCRARSGTAQPG